jgi:hypothetical protein
LTRQEQSKVDHISAAIGELMAGQKARGEQMDRIEGKIGQLTAEHTRTREMVIQHRTASQVMVWLGGAILAAWGAVKGFWIFEGK